MLPWSWRTHCCSRDKKRQVSFTALNWYVHVRVESGEDIKSKQIYLFIVVGGPPVENDQIQCIVRMHWSCAIRHPCWPRSCWFAIRHRRVWLAPTGVRTMACTTSTALCQSFFVVNWWLWVVSAHSLGTAACQHVRNSRVSKVPTKHMKSAWPAQSGNWSTSTTYKTQPK